MFVQIFLLLLLGSEELGSEEPLLGSLALLSRRLQKPNVAPLALKARPLLA
jgi:hypothetical protein